MLSQILSLVGPQKALLEEVKRRKLDWFGHVTRHESLVKTVLQGTEEEARYRGRQRKSLLENVKEWTRLTMSDLLTTAQDRAKWRRISVSSSLTPTLRLVQTKD